MRIKVSVSITDWILYVLISACCWSDAKLIEAVYRAAASAASISLSPIRKAVAAVTQGNCWEKAAAMF
jgi:hypothetical protein